MCTCLVFGSIGRQVSHAILFELFSPFSCLYRITNGWKKTTKEKKKKRRRGERKTCRSLSREWWPYYQVHNRRRCLPLSFVLPCVYIQKRKDKMMCVAAPFCFLILFLLALVFFVRYIYKCVRKNKPESICLSVSFLF